MSGGRIATERAGLCLSTDTALVRTISLVALQDCRPTSPDCSSLREARDPCPLVVYEGQVLGRANTHIYICDVCASQRGTSAALVWHKPSRWSSGTLPCRRPVRRRQAQIAAVTAAGCSWTTSLRLPKLRRSGVKAKLLNVTMRLFSVASAARLTSRPTPPTATIGGPVTFKQSMRLLHQHVPDAALPAPMLGLSRDGIERASGRMP